MSDIKNGKESLEELLVQRSYEDTEIIQINSDEKRGKKWSQIPSTLGCGSCW